MKHTILLIALLGLFIASCSTDEDPIGPGQSDVVLYINELLSTGDPDWLEIYNPSATAIDISGFHLYDSGSMGDKTLFPAGTVVPANGYLVWPCDDVQSNFKLSSGGESVYLEDGAGNLIDMVTFPALSDGEVYARIPDGSANWEIGSNDTPGSANSPVDPPTATVLINEFLASNTNGFTDELGEHDDWIELYNPGDQPVDLAGCHLSDDPALPGKWTFPIGQSQFTTIPAHGFLLLWADEQPDQGPLHIGWKLSATGETILLTDQTGAITWDSKTYTLQTTDVSTGRFPDGGATWQTFTQPTPGQSNGGSRVH